MRGLCERAHDPMQHSSGIYRNLERKKYYEAEYEAYRVHLKGAIQDPNPSKPACIRLVP